jgi:hypothetical protein
VLESTTICCLSESLFEFFYSLEKISHDIYHRITHPLQVLAVPKDRSKGLALLTEAESYAQSGEAAFLLGLACRRPAKAFEWYALAAQRGHPPGQAAAGRALYLGDGVESNQEEVSHAK